MTCPFPSAEIADPGCPGKLLHPSKHRLLVSSLCGCAAAQNRDLYNLILLSDSENTPGNECSTGFLLDLWTENFEPHGFLFSLQCRELRDLFWGPGISGTSTDPNPFHHSGGPPSERGALQSNILGEVTF